MIKDITMEVNMQAYTAFRKVSKNARCSTIQILMLVSVGEVSHFYQII